MANDGELKKAATDDDESRLLKWLVINASLTGITVFSAVLLRYLAPDWSVYWLLPAMSLVATLIVGYRLTPDHSTRTLYRILITVAVITALVMLPLL